MVKLNSLIITSLVAVGVSMSASAGNMLTLNLTDNTKQHYRFADQPQLSIDGADLKIVTLNAETSVPRAQISNFVFEEDVASIGGVNADTDDYTVTYLDPEHLQISGANVSSAAIYSVGGQLLRTFTAADNTIEVSLQGLAKGVYVVGVAGHESIKIMK